MPDVTRTGRSVVVLLLMRTVLLFAGTGIVLPFVDWSYNRALLWTSVTVVIADVITLLVLSQMLARQNRRLRDLLALQTALIDPPRHSSCCSLDSSSRLSLAIWLRIRGLLLPQEDGMVFPCGWDGGLCSSCR